MGEDRREAYLRIGKGTQSIIVLLTCSVPETQIIDLAVYHHIHSKVIKHSRDVFSRKSIGGVADQHTCLADGSIAHNHKLK